MFYQCKEWQGIGYKKCSTQDYWTGRSNGHGQKKEQLGPRISYLKKLELFSAAPRTTLRIPFCRAPKLPACILRAKVGLTLAVFHNPCLFSSQIQEYVQPTPGVDDTQQPDEREINQRQIWQEERPVQHIQRRKQASLKKFSTLKFQQ